MTCTYVKRAFTALIVLFGATVVAQPTAEQLAHLGTTLSPMGGEIAGNEAGTIPPWDGGITTPPANYKPGSHHVDPFADDKILYTIKGVNVGEYDHLLSEGQQYLLKRSSSYYLNVYPSRRSASYPQRIYDAALSNAGKAEITHEGMAIKNAAEGIPFPIPSSGVEAMWNFRLTYRGDELRRYDVRGTPSSSGQYELQVVVQEVKYPYSWAGATLDNIDNLLETLADHYMTPASRAGQILLNYSYMDMTDGSVSTWGYEPGSRRVNRAPSLNYDAPANSAEGLRTIDQNNMFSGGLDRYDWKLIGKQEMVVPYNAYYLHSNQHKISDVLKEGNINADLPRYELHRVWVVEAQRKADAQHFIGRRVLYLDEDSWQILLVDLYDDDDELIRFQERHSINYYEIPVFWTTLDVYYDLPSGRYSAGGVDNEYPMIDFSFRSRKNYYKPQSLRQIRKK